MELTLANVISDLLVLVFKLLVRDIEDFFSSAQFFFLILPKFFSTKLNSFWKKMQISNISEPSCNNNEIPEEEKGIQIAEINLILTRLGMGEINGKMRSSCEEDILGLFDEEEPSFEEIKETFGAFDVNKDGFIDANELQRVLCKLGFKEGCSLEECKRMIKSFDCNGDGLIDFQEFVKFMEKCLC